MGLGQVNTGGTKFFPEIGDGIEPDDPRALAKVVEQDVEVLEEHIGIGEIHIDLVAAEGGPEVPLLAFAHDRAVYRQIARPHDGGEVLLRIDFDEKVAVGGDVEHVVFEPFAAAGDVVDDDVKHQVEMFGDGLEVLPLAEILAHLAIVDDRETVIGGEREKRQHMHGGDDLLEIRGQEFAQGHERELVAGADRVGVGDEDGILLRPAGLVGRGVVHADFIATDQGVETQAHQRAVAVGVQAPHAIHDAVDDFLLAGGSHGHASVKPVMLVMRVRSERRSTL